MTVEGTRALGRREESEVAAKDQKVRITRALVKQNLEKIFS
jgi:hypothetical protein